MRRFTLLILVVLLSFACAPTGGSDGELSTQGDNSAKDEPVPTDEALMQPGDAGDGSIIMVNGRALRPAGDLVYVHNYPSNLLVLPDGTVVSSSLRGEGIDTIDGDSFTVISSLDLSATFYGLAANAAGDRLYVSGGLSQNIYEFSVTDGVPSLLRTFTTHGFPIGLALSADETHLLVTSSYGSSVQFFDLSTGLVDDQGPTSVYPYEVTVTADGEKIFVSNWGDSTLSVLDADNGELTAEIGVGMHPESMTLSPDGARLYVADSDSDTISVVNTATNSLIASYDVFDAENIVGASPNDVAVTADGETLYVAAAGLNAVVVMAADDGEVLGMIPTGYYPTAVALDESRNVIYVANGKGGGIPVARSGVSMSGTIERITIPDATELAAYTQTVHDNLTRTELFWETMAFESPIPTQVGTPSSQIKRVIFIMRENKTFDQELSDLPGVDGDTNNLIYGADRTPNTHAIAQMFTNCDNYYSEANVSIQGHMWSTMMYSNDYVEKAWASGRASLSGVEPAAIGGKNTIFHHLLNNNIPFRVYGQVVGTVADAATIAPHVDLKYGFWNLGVSDETKADEIIREWEAGIWPQFVYISLHNDHTNGSDAGAPTPRYYVGDNDAGLGKLIDYITHSEYWKETVVFVTEDDPQSGSDHVDPHRTVSLVISPYAKHGYISHVLYSMSSIWLTIQLILGIPPMSVYEENSSPMYDCFTMTPDLSTYTALPNPTPLEYNPTNLPLSEYSRRQNWGAPDQVRRLGEILWALERPGQTFPAHLSVDSYASESEDEDESEEAREYWEVAHAIEAYALAHGLWDGSRLPEIPKAAGRD